MRKLKYTGSSTKEAFEEATKRISDWYHTFEFDSGSKVTGWWDVAATADAHDFPTDLSGLKVLDIGPASGWYSFYFEQLGADVTAVDVRGPSDWDNFGEYEYRDVSEREVLEMRQNSPLLHMARLLDSKVNLVHARVYEICPELFGGVTFDLVFMGSLLIHLRDPIGALRAARSVCREKMIASTLLWDGGEGFDKPAARFVRPFPRSHDWWVPNSKCFEAWFEAAGFSTVNTSRSALLPANKIRPTRSGGISADDLPLRIAHAHV